MTTFTRYLQGEGIDPIAAMNALQSLTSIIADECVHAEDVAEADTRAAIAWLNENPL